MDIHLHDWRTKLILCKDLCAIFTTLILMFHMFSFRWKWLLEESDWASWIAQKIKNRLDVKREFTPQSKTKTIWQMYSDTNDIWCHPTHPPLPQNKCSQTVIGPMLDVEKALCPHHEVKLTFMKLKSQVGFLCWYGFKRHHCSTLLLLTSCALKLPYPRGMECLETSLLRSNLTYS